MIKKLIAFDLDGTIAPSKSPVPDRMASDLNQLLEKFEVCIISGGKFEQFYVQLLSCNILNPDHFNKLHIMPTCGTSYFRYNPKTKNWNNVYSEEIDPKDRQRISEALLKALEYYGYKEEKIYGEMVEDRKTQITLSVLGQDIVSALGNEGVKLKEAWDPDNTKKQKLRDYASKLVPEYEFRVGGLTSIDVTKPGIDKAYGMKKLIKELKIKKEDILFIGDRLQEGGNDFPVKAFRIDSIEIAKWEETALCIETILMLI